MSFARIVIVDWSAASRPTPARPSADAIWIGAADVDAGSGPDPVPDITAGARYFRTRHDAAAALHAEVRAALAAGQRILIGADFPLGYPSGFATAMTGTPRALALWDWLAARVIDAPDNRNNRFALAAAINAGFGGVGPFWGRPDTLDLPDLPARGSLRYGSLRYGNLRDGNLRDGHALPERRMVETLVPRAQSCWKLFTTGSVGSQALLGILHLARLRAAFEGKIAVWPFERHEDAPVVIAEVYPSLLAAETGAVLAAAAGSVKDAVQVTVLARAVASLARAGELDAMLHPPCDPMVLQEEGWILGVGHEAALRAAAARSGIARTFAETLADAQTPTGGHRQTARKQTARKAKTASAPKGGPDRKDRGPDTTPRTATAPRARPQPEPPTSSHPQAAVAALIPPRLRDDCFALPQGVDWVPVDDALDRLRSSLTPVAETATMPASRATGRILARDAVARRANPPAANSAVDGYGFAHAATAGGVQRLSLVAGRAAAGQPFAGQVPAGSAVRILTGAVLPDGVDTVVLEEDCATDGAQVAFDGPVKPGANTRRAGEDLPTGATALPRGHRLRAPDLALLAALGVQRVQVFRPLRVAVMSTGDEILATSDDPETPANDPSEDPADAPAHRIPDANRPMLLSLVAGWGHVPVDLGAAPDDPDEIVRRLDRGAAKADAILTSGGASAGDEDHIGRLLAAQGRLTSWRIAMKPGRPLALALWSGVPVFGLPGNPVAALVCALIFARPALGALAGADWQMPQGFSVPAAFSKTKKPGRREYLRARLDAQGRAEVFGSEGSGRISGLSWATGLVELGDGAMTVQPGDPVRFLPYSGFGI